MKSFQQKRGLRNVINSRPVLAILGVLVLFFAWGVFGFLGKMRITAENRRIAENKVTELLKEKEVLTADINKLKTQSGIEESIRDKFGLALEGENMIVIINDENSPPEDTVPKEGFFEPLFFWRNWFK